MKMTLLGKLKLFWYGTIRGWRIIHFGEGKPYEKFVICKPSKETKRG